MPTFSHMVLFKHSWHSWHITHWGSHNMSRKATRSFWRLYESAKIWPAGGVQYHRPVWPSVWYPSGHGLQVGFVPLTLASLRKWWAHERQYVLTGHS